MRMRRVESGWVVTLGGKEFSVIRDESGNWSFGQTQLFSPSDSGDQAKVVAILARALLACRKEKRALRDELIKAYDALGDLVHLKDISMTSKHYETVKLAHRPF